MVARARHPALLLAVGAASPQPQRIVSTAPSITEMLYALGLGDRVVGVTTFCHYPPEAARKPKIGNYLRPDVEADPGAASGPGDRREEHDPAGRLAAPAEAERAGGG